MLNICTNCGYVQRELVCLLLPTSSVNNNNNLKISDEKQDLILKVFDYFETESKLSLGESEMNISCMLFFFIMLK
jgi:hypothetical protein